MGDAGQHQDRRQSHRLGWVLAAVVVILAISLGVYALRSDIAIKFPMVGRAYSYLGIPMDSLDFDLSVSMENAQLIPGTDGKLLAVKGIIANPSRFVLNVPRLDVTVFDADNAIVAAWTETLPERRVLPNQSLPYTVQRSGIPERGAIVAVSAQASGRFAEIAALVTGVRNAVVSGASRLAEIFGRFAE